MIAFRIVSLVCFLCALPLLYAAGYARGRTDQIKEDLRRRHNVLGLSIDEE